MRKALVSLAALALTSSTALAAEKPATAAQIKKFIVGHDIHSAGAVLHYASDGSYTYNGGNPGKYTVTNGKVCVAFDSGAQRCDNIVIEDGAFSLVNAKGQHYALTQ